MSSSSRPEAAGGAAPGPYSGARSAGATRAGLVVGAVVLLVAAGVVEGVLSYRWGATGDATAAAKRLDGVPAAFGPWTSTESPIEKKILDRAEAIGSVSRVYKNRATGTEVSVLLLVGPAGPIGAHTPDICYAGLGYKMVGGEATRGIKLADGSTQTYWDGRFEKPDGGGILVSWAWGTDGNWAAATAPRRQFVDHTVLYKLYVSRGLTPAERAGRPADGKDPTQEFLTDFLPEVKRTLAAPPA